MAGCCDLFDNTVLKPSSLLLLTGMILTQKPSIYSFKKCSCLGTISLLNYSHLDYFYNIVSLAL